MFTDIIVKSRANMIQYTETNNDNITYAIVSISDYNADAPDFADDPNLFDCITVFFDDEEGGNTAMNETDAQEILDFVKSIENDIDILFVHCGGGVSRSAGTAAALMMLWYGDDSQIFNNGQYAPNMHCYRTMLDVAGFGYNSSDLAIKESQQYELWKIVHADDIDL